MGFLEEIRGDLFSFPEKIFFISSIFTKRKMGETRPPQCTVVVYIYSDKC
jgi:hypothetical protein